ncbi:hypothetical protein [Methylobacterium sp. Leaf88]|uniref:hypothetical protein n=1 Tax=Methylobacterium sp. Leaf88 TaxID=1736244 RepID=UPI0006F90BBB|nr:hypothetical protein [Methylobacterium sp. Leaf88]KQO76386.1 hypothetical protein ASF20_13625 [Methylobacterium sp. Leaf88]
MTNRIRTFAAAAILTLGALAPAAAADVASSFSVPAVIGAAYHAPGVALNASDIRRQGGLSVPSVSRWVQARAETVSVEPLKAPGVITRAYRNPRIASDASGVLRQGGFATAGVVRWLPTAPATAEADAGNVRLGSL